MLAYFLVVHNKQTNFWLLKTDSYLKLYSIIIKQNIYVRVYNWTYVPQSLLTNTLFDNIAPVLGNIKKRNEYLGIPYSDAVRKTYG